MTKRAAAFGLGLILLLAFGGGGFFWLRARREPPRQGAGGSAEGTRLSSAASSALPSFDGVALFPGRKRDHIPTVDRPVFAPTTPNTAALREEDWVLGVERGGIARAYPLWILARCEIVNDRFGVEPVCVTYCPLSASAVVFAAQVEGRPVRFGNEGSLYECNLVMYDRDTESLWYQLRGIAIAGPRLGEFLTRLPARLAPWAEWRRAYPETAVLVGDEQTGRFFRVGEEEAALPDPHADAPFAPVSRTDPGLPMMRRVVGIPQPSGTLGIDDDFIRTLPDGPHALPGSARTTLFIRGGRVTRVEGPGEREIPWVPAYWFAWHAAYPHGGLIRRLAEPPGVRTE